MTEPPAQRGTRVADEDSRRNPESPSWSRQWRSTADVPVLVAVVAAFGFVAGVQGLVVGVALALGWLVLPTVAVFVAGVVALTALVPADAAVATRGLPLVALGGLLATTAIAERRIENALAVGVAWLLVGGIVVATVEWSGAFWVAALALVGVAVVGFIGLAAVGVEQSGVGVDE